VQQQPFLAVVPASVRVAAIGAHDGEAPAEALPEESELQLAGPYGRARVIGLLRLEGSPVPDDHVAGAVLPRRDDALEREVLDRVVLGAHRQPALLRVERWALRHRPAHEHPIDLQPEVVVQCRGPMALHHEATRSVPHLARLGLGSLLESAFGPIGLEWHWRDHATWVAGTGLAALAHRAMDPREV
jgi:hypothetical protein